MARRFGLGACARALLRPRGPGRPGAWPGMTASVWSTAGARPGLEHPTGPTGPGGRTCASRHTSPSSGLSSRGSSAGVRRVGAAASAAHPWCRVPPAGGAAEDGGLALACGGGPVRASRQAWHGGPVAHPGASHATSHGDHRRRPARGETTPPRRGLPPTHVGARRRGHRRVARQRTRQRWAVGVEHVGRSLVRRGQAPVGTCLPTPLPGVGWSAGARRWRRWPHDRPCCARVGGIWYAQTLQPGRTPRVCPVVVMRPRWRRAPRAYATGVSPRCRSGRGGSTRVRSPHSASLGTATAWTPRRDGAPRRRAGSARLPRRMPCWCSTREAVGVCGHRLDIFRTTMCGAGGGLTTALRHRGGAGLP